MGKLVDPLVMEMEQEAEATRRVLGRVPGDKLAWKPHKRSYSLGQLAMHVASIPGDLSRLCQTDVLDVTTVTFAQPEAKSAVELLSTLEEGLREAKRVFGGMDDSRAMSPWKLVRGETELFTVPRLGFFRTFFLNHWYHHRGEMQVYLRLLDVPVPVVYGPTADENPFA